MGLRKIERDPNFQSIPASPMIETESGLVRSKAKILIVEDDDIIHRALALKLTKEGYKVIEAKDGAESLFKLAETQPDLVILDILMPMLNGQQVLRRYRSGDYPPTKFIIYTNSTDEKTHADLIDLGIAGYYVKANISLSDLMKEIERILSIKS